MNFYIFPITATSTAEENMQNQEEKFDWCRFLKSCSTCMAYGKLNHDYIVCSKPMTPEVFIELFQSDLSVPIYIMLKKWLETADPANAQECIAGCIAAAGFVVEDFRTLCSNLLEQLEQLKQVQHRVAYDQGTSELFDRYNGMCAAGIDAASRLASKILGREVHVSDFLIGTEYAFKPVVVEP